MKGLINFLIKIGKLKEMERRGWKLRGVKNPETIASHTFRMAIMAWVLGRKKKLNLNRVIKIALIHDLCEVYSGDITPYEHLLSGDKKKWKKIFDTWPKLLKKEKEKISIKKYKKESKGLKKLISKLPLTLKNEIKKLWIEYVQGLTPEGRFVHQVDRIENLLQALEYIKKGEKFSFAPWWIQIEETIDDPILLEFLKVLEKNFIKKSKLLLS